MGTGTNEPSKPNILVITTGGTIAMSKKTGSALSPSVNGKALLHRVSKTQDMVNLTLYEFSNVPSTWLGWREWSALSSITNDALSNKKYDGVVIVQGTDTIEELSYFFHLTIKSDKPVIFTGAMRGVDSPNYDGEQNLIDSIKVASNSESYGKGVLVVMGGEIHSARDVVKMDKYSLSSMSSGKKGVLGMVDEEGVVFYRKPLKKHTYKSKFAPHQHKGEIPNVHILYTYSGMNEEIVRNIIADSGTRGIIITGAGIGNVNKNLFTLLSKSTKTLKVVISSRVWEGRVIPFYGYEGGVETLRNIGCILGEDLHPLKARILLSLGLLHNLNEKQLQETFKEY